MSRVTWKVFLCIIPILVATNLSAQTPDTLWTRTYGGSENDAGHSVQETNDHGYIITGYTHSFTSGVYLIKTNIHGDTLWTRVYQAAPLCSGGWSVQQTRDGGYIIAGDNGRMWIIKTDPLGDTLWTKTFGGSTGAMTRSVLETSDTGFVFPHNIIVGSLFWVTGLTKLDMVGNIQWIKGYGQGTGMAIQETFDGGFIITGETHDSLYLRKTNQSGDTVWTSCCGIWPSRGFSVQQISDSGYVVTGAVDGTDIILVRYDTSGNVLWTKIYGGDGIDIGEAVAQTSDGGFIITGITDSFGAGSYDLYLIKTDVNGDTVWTKTYGGVGQEKGDYIQVAHDGNFIITGLTTSFGAGGSDVWLLKVTTNVGIANYEPVANERFHGATIVNGPLHLPEGKKCRIYDITGRVAEPDRIQSGIYFVEIDGILTQKVVKVK